MANYFLASVGNAEAFVKQGGQYLHFFSAKTLTDSSINISVSAEEVRGGTGAQLRGQFFHSANFGLSMTDAMFKLEYLAAQVGGQITSGGYGLTDESAVLAAGGTYTLQGTPIELLPGTERVVWYNRPGSLEYATFSFPASQADNFVVTIPGAAEGDDYCFHYYASQEDARTLLVSANFVPKELVIFLTVRAFAGDASAPETGRPIGSVTVKIPRFQLNGTVDLSLAMASAATIALEGTALAYEDSCDDAKYAEIVEFIDISPYDGYTSLVADGGEELNVGDTPSVYAIGAKKIPLAVDNADITFVPALQDGQIATGTQGEVKMTLTATADSASPLTGSFQVAAGA